MRESDSVSEAVGGCANEFVRAGVCEILCLLICLLFLLFIHLSLLSFSFISLNLYKVVVVVVVVVSNIFHTKYSFI